VLLTEHLVLMLVIAGLTNMKCLVLGLHTILSDNLSSVLKCNNIHLFWWFMQK